MVALDLSQQRILLVRCHCRSPEQELALGLLLLQLVVLLLQLVVLILQPRVQVDPLLQVQVDLLLQVQVHLPSEQLLQLSMKTSNLIQKRVLTHALSNFNKDSSNCFFTERET